MEMFLHHRRRCDNKWTTVPFSPVLDVFAVTTVLVLLLCSTQQCTAFTSSIPAAVDNKKNRIISTIKVKVPNVVRGGEQQRQLQQLLSSSSSSSLSMITDGATGMMENVDPSYNLAIGTFGIGLLAGFLEDLRDDNNNKLLTAKPFGGLAVLFTVLALFLAFQTTTLRFGFDDNSFALVKTNGGDRSASSSSAVIEENIVVGGENKWKYTSFVNYDYLPSAQFPILVYFRETQTPVTDREDVDVKILQRDTLDGQVHYFPAISNTRQLTEGFQTHGCSRID